MFSLKAWVKRSRSALTALGLSVAEAVVSGKRRKTCSHVRLTERIRSVKESYEECECVHLQESERARLNNK